MDAFSEILGGVALKGALFFSAEFSAPWGFSSPPSRNLAPALAPGAPHLVIYHFVIDGSGWLRLDVGYESEAAFNRAFKREFGLPPARYRREHRAAADGIRS